MYEDVRVLLDKENKHCCSLIKMVIFIFSILATCFGKELEPLYLCDFCQPEQLHISFGEKANDIVVTWSTFQSTNESRVQYGERYNNFNLEVNGTSKLFIDGGFLARSQYIHTVTLKDLKFGTNYVYHAGSVYGWSERFSFHTPPEGEGFPVRAAIYGDLGNADAHSLSFLQDEAERDNFDLILHVGDFAYDLDSEDAQVGDQFMRQIQPIAALVPYMTCPGNHEKMYNFSNYAARFSMPGRDASLFYSFDLGSVHFVSISTEVYYFTQYGVKLISNQYEWLKKDLAKANLPENRSNRPWIVVFGHRPMYCTTLNKDCDHEITRTGLNGTWALEPFLKDYGVDLVIWAHEHSYERTYPLYDGKMYKGSEEHPYVNPRGLDLIPQIRQISKKTKKFDWMAEFILQWPLPDPALQSILRHYNNVMRAPVHIITGSAGSKLEKSRFSHNQTDWSAFRSRDFGYTRFFAPNKTHIYMEQVSVELAGQVIDSFWLVKDEHKPYNFI